jgi:hypothetical protein
MEGKEMAAGISIGFAPRHAREFTAALAFLGAAMLSPPLQGQGLDDESTIETIIDAEVKTQERPLSEEQQRIVDAIARSTGNAAEIRKLTNVAEVEIVLVPDLAQKDSPLAARIEDNRAAIEELRDTIEGSAIFFHALDSHGVLLRDVVAVEFGSHDDVTVFAAGKPRD